MNRNGVNFCKPRAQWPGRDLDTHSNFARRKFSTRFQENVPTGQFSLDIPEDGEYNITVTGEEARGSVSFVKRDNSGL